MNPKSTSTWFARDELADLLNQAGEYALEYIDTRDQKPVFPMLEDIRALDNFEGSLPDEPTDAETVLSSLHEFGSSATVNQTAGRYFGFVNGSVLPAALAARWLADVWDQNSALYVMSPLVSRIEHLCERWLVELLGLPDGTALGLVTGSSSSIFCGLAAARHELLRRQDWDVNARGLFGAPQIRVITGTQAHASVLRALALLGIGKESIEFAGTDNQGRIDTRQLPALDDKTLVICQAGNVNSGAFDPFEEICESARAHGAWVHVDGAFGLWAGASRSKSHLFKGAELADSWSADAHKTLNAPYDCGIILCRNRDALHAAMDASPANAPYLHWSENRDGMAYVPDMSRRARAIDLWACLKSLGRSGVEGLVDQLCGRAREFADKLTLMDFHVRNDVVFNQVLVSCGNPELTQSTLRLIQSSGECWCGGTVWDEEPVIRISVCSWRTGSLDIERSVKAFVSARQSAQKSLGNNGIG